VPSDKNEQAWENRRLRGRAAPTFEGRIFETITFFGSRGNKLRQTCVNTYFYCLWKDRSESVGASSLAPLCGLAAKLKTRVGLLRVSVPVGQRIGALLEL